MIKQAAKVMGLILFVLVLGCTDHQPQKPKPHPIIDVKNLPPDKIFMGDWVVISIDGETPEEMLNSDADEHLKNIVPMSWYFHTDRAWKCSMVYATSFRDTPFHDMPELRIQIRADFTGTYTQKGDTLSVVMENVTAEVLVKPPVNNQKLFYTKESAIGEQYAEYLLENEIFSGEYHWKGGEFELTLTDADGREIKFCRAVIAGYM